MGHESRRFLATRSRKQPAPLWSYEFLCQNHGDIMSCIILFIIIGLVFSFTNPISSLFMLPQYNETIISSTSNKTEILYSYGFFDVPNFLFYSIVWITIHALIQEYVLDKIQRKHHLSRTSMSKFFESGHLFLFSLYSAIHSLMIVYENNYIENPSQMWMNYPKSHRKIGISMKMFYLLQISYWIHQFPCFYFQKVKKDEMATRSAYSTAYLLLIMASYYMNFTKCAVLLLFFQYFILTLYHCGRICLLLGKKRRAFIFFVLYNIFFMITKILSVLTTILTFGNGLNINENNDDEEGNFNTTTKRFTILLIMTSMQIFQIMKFFMKLMSIYSIRYRKKKSFHDKNDCKEEEKSKNK
uniref:TLC domain-containing protein n=1 Tax=Strongyloides venezuelensis TaxID=75913 RepID=A0A0K0F0F4_STRVS